MVSICEVARAALSKVPPVKLPTIGLSTVKLAAAVTSRIERSL